MSESDMLVVACRFPTDTAAPLPCLLPLIYPKRSIARYACACCRRTGSRRRAQLAAGVRPQGGQVHPQAPGRCVSQMLCRPRQSAPVQGQTPHRRRVHHAQHGQNLGHPICACPASAGCGSGATIPMLDTRPCRPGSGRKARPPSSGGTPTWSMPCRATRSSRILGCSLQIRLGCAVWTRPRKSLSCHRSLEWVQSSRKVENWSRGACIFLYTVWIVL